MQQTQSSPILLRFHLFGALIVSAAGEEAEEARLHRADGFRLFQRSYLALQPLHQLHLGQKQVAWTWQAHGVRPVPGVLLVQALRTLFTAAAGLKARSMVMQARMFLPAPRRPRCGLAGP